MVPPGKYLAGGLQSDCTANLTGVQYILITTNTVNETQPVFPDRVSAAPFVVFKQ